jgi:hypothetical protein
MRKLLYFIPVLGVVFCAVDIIREKMSDKYNFITAAYHAVFIVTTVIVILNYSKG